MAGPFIQMPATAAQMFDFHRNSKGEVVTINMKPEWAALVQSLAQTAYASSRNGSTTSRPTESFEGRYEGMPFFDRDLGYPVFLKHASSNIWVRYDGAVV